MDDIKNFLKNLTHHPGVYQMLDAKGDVIYVGKAKDLKKRVSSYFSGRSQDTKTATLVRQIENIDITVTSSEYEALILESNLIKTHKPRYNVLLRDDKSYPYIFISGHAFPRIDLYRGKRKKDGLYFGPYPSAMAVREAIDLIQKLFKLRTCKDSFFQSRTRPCLLYQINRCTAPCVEFITKSDYADSVNLAALFLEGKNDLLIDTLQKKMEASAIEKQYEEAAKYRDQIMRLRQLRDKQYVNVSSGHADAIGVASRSGTTCVHLLSVRDGQTLGSRTYFPIVPAGSSDEEVVAAFIKQHYLAHEDQFEIIPREIITTHIPNDYELIETVLSSLSNHKVKMTLPGFGDKKKWLSMATSSANQALVAQIYHKMNANEKMNSLANTFALVAVPTRVECFDISHTMGEAIVASCVVFDRNGAVKSDYRRFNINDITPGDDVAAMRQVLSRRFKRLQADGARLPDLVLVDGGKTQLNAAKSVFAELGIHHVQLMGVSKGPGRKAGYETIHFNGERRHLEADSEALHFIQQIRDEAHRFAITGHRMRRDKSRQKSVLETIPGVGAQRRRELLRYFGGIQGIAHASLDELKKVQGISQLIAGRIFAAFHDKSR
jgi:excinuclease ABC subunit C